MQLGERERGPGDVAGGGAAEPERPEERGLAVLAFEAGEEGPVAVELHRTGGVRLAYPAVGVLLVVGLHEQEGVADDPGPAHVVAGRVRQVGEDRERVVVHEGGGHQTALVVVALQQARLVALDVGVLHGVQVGVGAVDRLGEVTVDEVAQRAGGRWEEIWAAAASGTSSGPATVAAAATAGSARMLRRDMVTGLAGRSADMQSPEDIG